MKMALAARNPMRFGILYFLAVRVVLIAVAATRERLRSPPDVRRQATPAAAG